MTILGKTVFTYGVRCCRDVFMFAMMDTEKNGIRHYHIDRNGSQLDKIVSSLMCDGVCWITYNGQYYDSTILNYIIMNYKELSLKSPSECAYLIYSFSLTVWNNPVREWVGYKHAGKFFSIDLSPMFYNRGFRTFGEVKAQLGYNDVREREVDSRLSYGSRRNLMSKYLDLDLAEYGRIVDDMADELMFREFIYNEYKLNVFNSTPSELAFRLFSLLYESKTKTKLEGEGISRARIDFKDFLPDKIRFGEYLNEDMYDKLHDMYVTSEDSDINLDVQGVYAKLTGAGLKGFRGAGVFRGGNGRHIYIADIRSAWPSTALKHNICPENVDLEGFKYAMNVLMSLRRDTGYVRHFKNVMNAIIGMFGVRESPLHDYKAFMAVRIISAIETVCMISSLYDFCRIEMLQVNNDGVVFMCDVPYENMRHGLSEWSDTNGFSVSLDEYDIFAQHSINNWFAISGRIVTKRKGIFESGSQKYPLGVCDAVINSIIEDEPVDKMLASVPKKRFMTVKTLSDGEEFAIKQEDVYVSLGNIVRCYKSADVRELYKHNPSRGGYHLIDGNTGLSTDRNAMIDYKWYAVKAYQLYTELTTKQLELF